MRLVTGSDDAGIPLKEGVCRRHKTTTIETKAMPDAVKYNL